MQIDLNEKDKEKLETIKGKEEQIQKLRGDVEVLKNRIDGLNIKKGTKWASRKLIVVIIFGLAYPLMTLIPGISFPIEAVYVIVAYLLGQSAIDFIEKLPKRGQTESKENIKK